MKTLFIYTILLFSIIACNTTQQKSQTPDIIEKPSLENEVTSETKIITRSTAENEIDNYIKSIEIDKNTYAVKQSLRFSTDTKQYNVEAFNSDEKTIIYIEEYMDAFKGFTRTLYLKDGELTYVKETGYDTSIDTDGEDYEIETYFLNNNQIDYKRIISGSDTTNYAILPSKVNYDLNRIKDALNQKGDFEMRFGEFLIIKPQSYLVLENKDSQYNVALFIIKGDPLLDDLYTNPTKYKGKVIYAKHEFSIIGGAERMVYLGAELVD